MSDTLKVDKRVKVEQQATKDELLAQIGVILTEYNNLESNIPLSHEYWALVNLYRATE